MGKRGHPKNFKSANDLIKLWSDFCDDICANEFYTIPSQTAFCRWLSTHYQQTDRRTIYNSLNKYFPEVKKDFERIQSDTIMQGGMLGRYQSAMSIFGLKNWCGWVDKVEATTTNTTTTTIDMSKLSTDQIKEMLDEEVNK